VPIKPLEEDRMIGATGVSPGDAAITETSDAPIAYRIFTPNAI
jgi:hypothetical protein